MVNSLPTRAILGAGTAVLAGAVVACSGSGPLALAVISAALVAGLARVASAAQSRPLRDEDGLVYRPVYVRRQDRRHRLPSDD